MHMFNWDLAYKFKGGEGIGLREPHLMNLALLSKHYWRTLDKNNIWTNIVKPMIEATNMSQSKGKKVATNRILTRAF